MRYAAGLALVAVMAVQAGTARADGDPAAGKVVFNKCMACHSVKEGENKIGPSLHGVVGRPSHSVANFNYSPAMKAYDVTWDQATLDHYLIDPRATVPNTKMIFPGLKVEQDRQNLIAYLDTLK
jgi:cytochrome c